MQFLVLWRQAALGGDVHHEDRLAAVLGEICGAALKAFDFHVIDRHESDSNLGLCPRGSYIGHMGDILVGTASWTDKTLLESGWYPPEVKTAESA